MIFESLRANGYRVTPIKRFDFGSAINLNIRDDLADCFFAVELGGIIRFLRSSLGRECNAIAQQLRDAGFRTGFVAAKDGFVVIREDDSDAVTSTWTSDMSRYDETCATCRFWQRYHLKLNHRTYGECRIRSMTIKGNWPITTFDDWCGEHQPIKPPEVQTR